MIFIDTSIWIEYFRGRNQQIVHHLNELLDVDQVALAYPVKIELLTGASKKDLATLKSVLSALPVLVPSEAVWPLMESWITRATERGQGFGMADLMIAAISVEQKSSLWSLDQDFMRMEKLGFLICHQP
jgi:predicted nucleic acid-binding protein